MNINWSAIFAALLLMSVSVVPAAAEMTKDDYQEYISNFVGALSYQLPEPVSTLSSLLFAAPNGTKAALKFWAYDKMLSSARNLLDADQAGSAEQIKYYNDQLGRWQAVYNCLDGDCGAMKQLEGAGGATEGTGSDGAGGSSTGSTGSTGSGVANSGNLSYRKGSLLVGPITIPANWTTPTDVLFLDIGRPYFIVGEGTCSLWSDQTEGVDSCFCYAKWRIGDTPVVWGQLELIDPSVHLSDLINKDAQGNPIYSSSHVYEGVVIGEGKQLKARVYDGGGYEDNNGALQISVYDAVPVE
jgi:hypothetical protein